MKRQLRMAMVMRMNSSFFNLRQICTVQDAKLFASRPTRGRPRRAERAMLPAGLEVKIVMRMIMMMRMRMRPGHSLFFNALEFFAGFAKDHASSAPRDLLFPASTARHHCVIDFTSPSARKPSFFRKSLKSAASRPFSGGTPHPPYARICQC